MLKSCVDIVFVEINAVFVEFNIFLTNNLNKQQIKPITNARRDGDI